MPGLKDLLKKKEKIANDETPSQPGNLDVPEFKFIRSSTGMEELIEIPSYTDTPEYSASKKEDKRPQSSSELKHKFHFRKSSNADVTKDPTAVVGSRELPTRSKEEKRLSGKLHFRKASRSPSAESSSHLPTDLPDAPAAVEPIRPNTPGDAPEKTLNEQREAQWEERATILAQTNPILESERQNVHERKADQSRSPSISDKRGDENIQEAIRLHEIGELSLSTAMFGRLGNPNGANNALDQVLYGLALRHGWGIEIDAEKAVHYLSLAASNSASV